MADNKHDQAATITRRSAMQAGAGAVLASGVPLFWSGEARADKAKIDAVLSGAVVVGQRPGRRGGRRRRQGRHLRRRLRQAQPRHRRRDDAGHGVLDRLDDQGGDLDGRHADGRAGQAQSRQADQRRRHGARAPRRCWRASTPRASPSCRPPKRPITLRHLLTHTAGFSYDLWNKDIERYMKVANVPGIGTCKLEALKVPMIADPGDSWEYGINIDWAGKAVERVSGLSLDDYMREHIFDAARHEGHRSSSCGPTSRRAWRPSMRAAPTASSTRSSSACRRRPSSSWAAAASTRPGRDYLALPADAAGRRQARQRADPQAGDRRA